jgi:cyclophilin family peptidyl-prolyl cis-trans isomerase/HEAT repeat protein
MRLLAAAFTLILAQAALSAPSVDSVVAAERAWSGPDVLLPLARSSDGATAVAAIRALGRLQDPSLVAPLLDFENSASKDIQTAAASALAQTLVTASPKTDGAVLTRVADQLQRHRRWDALSRIALPTPQIASSVEAMLDDTLRETAAGTANVPLRSAAAVAYESLARRNARLEGFALAPASISLLESIVLRRHENDAAPEVRRYALWALNQARAATPAALRAAADDSDDQTRRLAVQALGTNGSAPALSDASAAIEHALADRSIIVRVEAVRSYAKRVAPASGCGPLLKALDDDASHVVDVALDALGTACPQNPAVTDRLAREAAAATVGGRWQRRAHAFAALAVRDPARAKPLMPALAADPTWQVRMYAARAATSSKNEPALEQLAMDTSDNVRSAALPALHALSPERARPALIAALARSDYQVLRTAATELKTAAPSPAIAGALVAALRRATSGQKQTSRDARLPLLDALAVHGSPDNAHDIEPLLTDVDPQVASRAAAILTKWGRTAAAAPARVTHDPKPQFADSSACVAIEFTGGRRMRVRPDPAAPVTVDRFLELALTQHFYDGLTFHRVEPNFVIQGGSRGANEYASDLDRFMRDEIGVANTRGAVGLSTRGLNTADGQIYVMLVDDPRLDGRFTIFAHVFDAAEDMRTLDGIQEGDAIEKITRTACPATR